MAIDNGFGCIFNCIAVGYWMGILAAVVLILLTYIQEQRTHRSWEGHIPTFLHMWGVRGVHNFMTILHVM